MTWGRVDLTDVATGGVSSAPMIKNVHIFIHEDYNDNEEQEVNGEYWDIGIIYLSPDQEIPLPTKIEDINIVNRMCLKSNPEFKFDQHTPVFQAGFGKTITGPATRTNENKKLWKMDATLADNVYSSDINFAFSKIVEPFSITCSVSVKYSL